MNTYMIPLAIGAPQIILIVVVVLLLFGGKKIPELMKGLGGGIKEFKKASIHEFLYEYVMIFPSETLHHKHGTDENKFLHVSSYVLIETYY